MSKLWPAACSLLVSTAVLGLLMAGNRRIHTTELFLRWTGYRYFVPEQFVNSPVHDTRSYDDKPAFDGTHNMRNWGVPPDGVLVSKDCAILPRKDCLPAESEGWRHGKKAPASVDVFLRKRNVIWRRPYLMPSRGEEEARRVFAKRAPRPPLATIRQGWNFGQTPLSEPGLGRSTMETIPMSVMKHFAPVKILGQPQQAVVETAPVFVSVERHQIPPLHSSSSATSGQQSQAVADTAPSHEQGKQDSPEYKNPSAAMRAQRSTYLPRFVEVPASPLLTRGVMERVLLPERSGTATSQASYPLRVPIAAQAHLANFLREGPALPQQIEIKLNRNFLPEMKRSAINRLLEKWKKEHSQSSSSPSSSSTSGADDEVVRSDDEVDSISKESKDVEHLGLSFVRALRSFVDQSSTSRADSILLHMGQKRRSAAVPPGTREEAGVVGSKSRRRSETHSTRARGGPKVDRPSYSNLVGDLKNVEGILQTDLKKVRAQLHKS